EGAHQELLDLAEQLQAPIVHAMRGKEHVEYNNPYDDGMTGLLGFASGYRAMIDAEALLMIGTDLPYRQFYPDAPVIQIDNRGEQIGKRVPVEVPLVGTAKDTMRELTARLKPAKSSRHLSKMRDHYQKTRQKLDELARPSRGSRPTHPQYLTRGVSERPTDETVVVPDVAA